MLERKIYSDLLEWKNRRHKCLLVSGQRQVGKTFIIRHFGSTEYDNVVEINFDTMSDAKKAFEGDLTVDRILERISILYPGTVFEEDRTLIFLDEIQECESAFASLKQFTEDGRYDVIASGSLMGVKTPKLSRKDGNVNHLVPMGYEENLRMYSMDFEEFLWAIKFPRNAIEEVKECIRCRKTIDPVILDKLNACYRQFMVVGGMPEAVSSFVSEEGISGVRTVLKDIRSECLRDINRYNRGADIIKTSECFESIPDNLSRTNKKFMYSRIDDNQSRQSADKYMGNLLWIKAAGYGNFCYGVEAPTLPLRSKRDVFKVYLSDTGMLVSMYGDNCMKAIYTGDLSYNIGAIAENEVAESLMKCGYTPRYYVNQKGEGRMELDFVVENGCGACAIEVKSGKSRNAPSIKKAPKFFDISMRVMLAEDNVFTDDEGILHLPMFAASFFRELEPDGNDMPDGCGNTAF